MIAIPSNLPLVRRPHLSATLLGYIARLYLFWLLAYFMALTAIIGLVSAADLLDRLGEKDVPLVSVFQLLFLRLPHMSQEVLPFVVLFAGMTTFWRLTRSNELVVARAAGISVWQFLLPCLGLAVATGLFAMMLLNPVAAALLGAYERVEAQYLHNQQSLMTVSGNGLWMRQSDGQDGQAVIHALRADNLEMELHDVIIFRYGPEDHFISRIDAKTARLEDGYWLIRDAWVGGSGLPSQHWDDIQLDTDLTRERILDSFAPPETLSFWQLPGFINLLERAGFSAARHRLHFNRLIALPVLFAAMVLFAATFSLRQQRRGRIGLIIAAGVIAGFLLYFLSNFIYALGLSGKIPAALAAWTPASVAMAIGLASLLHLEDG